jgi:hypothetical protein
MPPNPSIEVPRLFADLAITEEVLQSVASLDIPANIRVTSGGDIKTGTVKDVLRIMCPDREFGVIGNRYPSGVAEQPLGQETIDGALNRLRNGMRADEETTPGKTARTGWFSIENGLFRVAERGALLSAVDRRAEEIVQFTADADLNSDFDPDAEYEDRAVAAIRLPGQPTIVHISPVNEAVRFPRAAVLAAYYAEGGLERQTVGSKLVEMGIVRDTQNPHPELTAGRAGGPLSRQDQMARVLARGLVWLAEQ